MTREELDAGRARASIVEFWLTLGIAVTALGASFAMLPK